MMEYGVSVALDIDSWRDGAMAISQDFHTFIVLGALVRVPRLAYRETGLLVDYADLLRPGTAV